MFERPDMRTKIPKLTHREQESTGSISHDPNLTFIGGP